MRPTPKAIEPRTSPNGKPADCGDDREDAGNRADDDSERGHATDVMRHASLAR
jgi:hypothetical protein